MIMRFDHVGVNVADLAAAEAWYCKAFGLERDLAVRIDAAGLDIVMLRSERSGHRVELLYREGSRPGLRAGTPAQAALTQGFGHIAFDVPDLDAAHEHLLSAGARAVMAPQPSPEPGVRMAFVADPEGNLIELVERPRD
jgi:glyoxylase I family protein